jgi:hypothetical protein
MATRHVEPGREARDAPLARPPDDRARAARGGVVAGLAGGVTIALFQLGVNLFQGAPLAPVFKGAAFPFFSMEQILSPAFSPAPVVVGLVSHFAISIVWGLLFGLLFYGLGRMGTALAGLFWGLVVWLGMFYVLLPIVGAFGVTQATPLWQAVSMHLVFGLAAGLAFLPFQRRVPRRTQPLSRGRTAGMDRRIPVT